MIPALERSLRWKDPLEEEMAPTPVLLPGESLGQKSLAGYSPWSFRASDMTEHTAAAATRATGLSPR